MEEWRRIDLPELADYNYEVSNLGNVRNANTNKIIKQCLDKKGYEQLCLGDSNRHRLTYKVHRLVALAFIPNPENKPQVNHLGAKDDNRLCMLEWATAKENSLHGAKKNRMNKHNQVLSIAKINKKTNEIIKIYKSIIDIENDGYTYRKVYKCINGENHTHLGYKWQTHEKNKNYKTNSNNDLENEIWKSLKDSMYNEVNIYKNHSVSNYGRVKGFYDKILS